MTPEMVDRGVSAMPNGVETVGEPGDDFAYLAKIDRIVGLR